MPSASLQTLVSRLWFFTRRTVLSLPGQAKPPPLCAEAGTGGTQGTCRKALTWRVLEARLFVEVLMYWSVLVNTESVPGSRIKESSPPELGILHRVRRVLLRGVHTVSSVAEHHPLCAHKADYSDSLTSLMISALTWLQSSGREGKGVNMINKHFITNLLCFITPSSGTGLLSPSPLNLPRSLGGSWPGKWFLPHLKPCYTIILWLWKWFWGSTAAK